MSNMIAEYWEVFEDGGRRALPPADEMILVFGSNLAGRHGKGAALAARHDYGAEYGVGVGPTGKAYALPTKDAKLRPLPLDTIATHVNAFIVYASEHPDVHFRVTRVGCGYAGYLDEQIAPMFASAPANCHLPRGWRENNQTGSASLADADLPGAVRAPSVVKE